MRIPHHDADARGPDADVGDLASWRRLASPPGLNARARLDRAVARARLDRAVARIEALDPVLRAWVHWDPAPAFARAAGLDRDRASPPADRPLWGMPVGVKDVIDTADWPTEHGCTLHRGRRPGRDARLVQRLHAAGALVLGKTVTTELATYAPGPTRNPHDPGCTPGGSSSGSAAAVAAGMVPLAVGTQTNGSVIRPASFCGVVGFKPTFGRIPTDGVLACAPSLDQVGVLARSVSDAGLLAAVLAGVEPGWADACAPLPSPPPLRLAWAEPPGWTRMAPDAAAAFRALLAQLGPVLRSRPWPRAAAEVHGWHQRLMEAELALAFGSLADAAPPGALSASLLAQITRGRRVALAEVRATRARQHELREVFDRALDTAGTDAWLTPAALGGAPEGLASTGDPWMCTPWTFAGLPAISLPLLRDDRGMPLGVQLVGRAGREADLLRAAATLVAHCRGQA